jgi:RNA polymerase sigma factor (TIGR02999 family)
MGTIQSIMNFSGCHIFLGEPRSEVTRILTGIAQGEPSAGEQLLPLVSDELRKLAAQKLAQEKPRQTLQATALVHETYLRLVEVGQAQPWNSRGSFFRGRGRSHAAGPGRAARHKQTPKAGGGYRRLNLEAIDPAVEQGEGERLLALDEALQQLEVEDPRKAKLVKLRFFVGLTTKRQPLSLASPYPRLRRTGPTPGVGCA